MTITELSCTLIVWCNSRCLGAAIHITQGVEGLFDTVVVQPPTPPFTPLPLKISLIWQIWIHPRHSLPLASQQCGASVNVRGWSAGNQKQTHQVGFGWWSNHPPYCTKIHPTQPPHNHPDPSCIAGRFGQSRATHHTHMEGCGHQCKGVAI